MFNHLNSTMNEALIRHELKSYRHHVLQMMQYTFLDFQSSNVVVLGNVVPFLTASNIGKPIDILGTN